jgi:hypothetical protein
MRELIGHKLTQRQRKDLDEISDKTGIRIKSCRRQVYLKHQQSLNRIDHQINKKTHINCIITIPSL